jgi:hypothetical protein
MFAPASRLSLTQWDPGRSASRATDQWRSSRSSGALHGSWVLTTEELEAKKTEVLARM